MQIIGAGFGRTGTTSLRAGLEQLGFDPCLHGFDFMGHRDRIRGWITASRDPQHADWDGLLAGYQACLDFPMAAYWRELAAHYPGAKVILTVRNEQSWYDSMARTVFRIPLHLPSPVRRVLNPLLDRTSSWLPPYPAMYTGIVYVGIFGDRLDREHAIDVYRRHNAQVIASLPPERLLVWEARDGWEPLCAFLGVPVPDAPFPRLNDAASFRRMLVRWPAFVARQAGAAVRHRFSRPRRHVADEPAGRAGRR